MFRERQKEQKKLERLEEEEEEGTKGLRKQAMHTPYTSPIPKHG